MVLRDREAYKVLYLYYKVSTKRMYDEWVDEMRNRGKRYKRQAQVETFVFWFTVVLLTVAVVIITGELSGFTSRVLGTF